MLNNLIGYYNINGAIIKGKGLLLNVNIKAFYPKFIKLFCIGFKGIYCKQICLFLDFIFYIFKVSSTSSADIKNTN